jgi:uncharacterized protein
MTGTTSAIVDACVHPVPPNPGDLTAYLSPEFRRERMNRPEGGQYPVPISPYREGTQPEVGEPASDPVLMARQVLDEPGADFAILLPLTRGMVADSAFDAAICAATNDWQAATWLGEYNSAGRYKGTLRVAPRDPSAAVREIERWAGHPHFVQVGVPLESHVAYGEQVYFDIWKAASEHGLPVVVHADRAGGVLPAPTAQGYPGTFLEEYSQQPLYVMTQLCSLIAHGVFERLPALRFVFADGGFDYVQTLTWRMDKEWRASHSEVPWVKRTPRLYMEEQVSFIIHRSDGPEDPAKFASFIENNGLEKLLIYGSNYPSWDYLAAESAADMLAADSRALVMGENARRLYRLPVTTATEPVQS